MVTATKTRWQMTGQGYEFCNCDFGCGCNFGGFPNSKDGSCRALVGFTVTKGRCGDIDLSRVKGAAIFVWPKAIHEGNGQAAFIVDPATTEKQVEALSQIFTGQLGGLPWELLGPTFKVVGLATPFAHALDAKRALAPTALDRDLCLHETDDLEGRRSRERKDHDRGQWAQEHVSHRGRGRRAWRGRRP